MPLAFNDMVSEDGLKVFVDARLGMVEHSLSVDSLVIGDAKRM